MREAAEETGLRVSVPRLLHTKQCPASVHDTFGCELDGGELRTSDESLEVAFVSPDEIDQWHTDHHERLTAALAKLS